MPQLALNVKNFISKNPKFEKIIRHYYQALRTAGLTLQISAVMQNKYLLSLAAEKTSVIDTNEDGKLLVKLSFNVKTKTNGLSDQGTSIYDFFDQGAVDIALILENDQWQFKSIQSDCSLLTLALFKEQFSNAEIKFFEIFTAVRSQDFDASPAQLIALARLGAQVQAELQKAIEAKITGHQPIKEINLEAFRCFGEFNALACKAELARLNELKSALLKHLKALKNSKVSSKAELAMEKIVKLLHETASKAMLAAPSQSAKSCPEYIFLDQLKTIFDYENGPLQTKITSLIKNGKLNETKLRAAYRTANKHRNTYETKLSELNQFKDSVSSETKDPASEKVINTLYTHLKDQLILHKRTISSFNLKDQPTYNHLEKFKEALMLENALTNSLAELSPQPGSTLYCEVAKNAQTAFSQSLRSLFLSSVKKPADFSMAKVNYLSNQLQNLTATTEDLKKCYVETSDKAKYQTQLKTQLQKQIKEAKEKVPGLEKLVRVVEKVVKIAALAALGAIILKTAVDRRFQPPAATI